MNGEDKDLAAHFTMIRKYGIVLYGEPVDSVFAPVPRENYIDSIYADIKNAKQDIMEDPVYITLNLCRVLAFLKDGLYLSKEEGESGAWNICLKNIILLLWVQQSVMPQEKIWKWKKGWLVSLQRKFCVW